MTDALFDVYTGHPAPGGDALPDVPTLWDQESGQWRDANAYECHVQVRIGGHDYTEWTIAKLEISGGRGDKLGQVDPATVALSLVIPDAAGGVRPVFGDWVDICGWLPGLPRSAANAALFHGTVTDIAVEADVLSIVAVDPLRLLDGLFVGDTPWPVQMWDDRVLSVWQATRAAAVSTLWGGATPPWLKADLFQPLGPAGLPDANMLTVGRRDVDHQKALDLLDHYLVPVQGAVWYRPSTAWPAPYPGLLEDTIAAWKPRVWITSGFWAWPLGWEAPHTDVDACFIVADPPHRLWQNLTQVANEVRVRWWGPPEQGQTDPTDVDGTWKSDQQLIDRYGNRGVSLGTELVDPSSAPAGGTWGDAAHQWGDHDAKWLEAQASASAGARRLAEDWLARHEVPVWSCDNVTVVLTEETIADAGEAAAMSAWNVVAWGPSQVGRYCVLRGIPSGATIRGDSTGQGGGWVIEGTTIRWAVDGWEVDLQCSNPMAYLGGVLGQTEVLIRPLGRPWQPGVPIPAGGQGLWLQILIRRPYAQEYITEGTITVAGLSVHVDAIPVAEHGGLWTLVPLPPLAGETTITAHFTPAAGSGDRPSDGQVVVDAHPQWVTWDQIPAGATWNAAPTGTTWDTALQPGDW